MAAPPLIRHYERAFPRQRGNLATSFSLLVFVTIFISSSIYQVTADQLFALQLVLVGTTLEFRAGRRQAGKQAASLLET